MKKRRTEGRGQKSEDQKRRSLEVKKVRRLENQTDIRKKSVGAGLVSARFSGRAMNVFGQAHRPAPTVLLEIAVNSEDRNL